MAEKVLLVDDDENVLHGYHRVLHRSFALEVAMGGVQAIQAMVNHGPFAVIVADMRMPNMSGLEVLRETQRLSPDTTRLMLTGNLDQPTAMNAVNQGHVFRFLTKPCSPAELALHASHYDGRVLEALYSQFGTPAATAESLQERPCPVEELQAGMLLARNVLTRSGRPVLMAGLRLGAAHLVLLRDLVEILDISEPVHVTIG